VCPCAPALKLEKKGEAMNSSRLIHPSPADAPISVMAMINSGPSSSAYVNERLNSGIFIYVYIFWNICILKYKCKYVCIHIHQVYICTDVNIQIYKYIICKNTNIFIYTYYVYIGIHIYIHIYIYTHIGLRACAFVFVCVYICI